MKKFTRKKLRLKLLIFSANVSWPELIVVIVFNVFLSEKRKLNLWKFFSLRFAFCLFATREMNFFDVATKGEEKVGQRRMKTIIDWMIILSFPIWTCKAKLNFNFSVLFDFLVFKFSFQIFFKPRLFIHPLYTSHHITFHPSEKSNIAFLCHAWWIKRRKKTYEKWFLSKRKYTKKVLTPEVGWRKEGEMKRKHQMRVETKNVFLATFSLPENFEQSKCLH